MIYNGIGHDLSTIYWSSITPTLKYHNLIIECLRYFCLNYVVEVDVYGKTVSFLRLMFNLKPSFQVKQMLDEIMEKLPEEFNMVEIMGKVEERTPYVIVAFQECERMNYLTGEMKRSLRELDLGLKVSGNKVFI